VLTGVETGARVVHQPVGAVHLVGVQARLVQQVGGKPALRVGVGGGGGGGGVGGWGGGGG
jgi:hypothetical protein